MDTETTEGKMEETKMSEAGENTEPKVPVEINLERVDVLELMLQTEQQRRMDEEQKRLVAEQQRIEAEKATLGEKNARYILEMNQKYNVDLREFSINLETGIATKGRPQGG